MRFHAIGAFSAMTFVASAAHADQLGFVATLGGSISSAETYNSAGGTNSLVFVGDTFQVTLPGLGNGLNSDVQVGAENTNGSGHYCTVINWGSNGTDVTVNVACFDQSGNPELADFSMLYQVRTTRPVGADIAFVWADQPSSPSYTPNSNYSFNSIGGANTITRSSPGNYTVILGDFQVRDTNVQVTAYGNTAARCQVAGWMKGFSDGAHVNVRCVNAANTPTDEFYTLTYTLGGVEGSGHLVGAFAWANNANKKHYTPKKSFQFSNISQAQFLTAQRFGGLEHGQYSLNIPNPGNLSFQAYLGMVTSYGSNGEYCDSSGISVISGEIDLESVCYGATGIQTNTKYSGTLMTVPEN